MARKNARNNELLRNAKIKTSPPIYSLLVDLVNEDREEQAEVVLKIDYLLEYASNSIKQKDFEEAKIGLSKAKTRLEALSAEEINVEYLEHLYEGIAKKCKT